MINITDIYSFVGKSLMENNYYSLNNNAKKELVTEKLKEYLTYKINIIRPNQLPTSNEYSLIELFDNLAALILQEEHENTLRHFIHFLLKIIGEIQMWEVVWEVSSDAKFSNNPEFNFDLNGRLNSLKTSINEDYIQTFHSVYAFYHDYFLEGLELSSNPIR